MYETYPGVPQFWTRKFWREICYNMIYLLTAIALAPGGSSTVHIYKKSNTQNNTTIFKECGSCPVSASYTLAFALQLKKKNGETSVRVAEECQLAGCKQNIPWTSNHFISKGHICYCGAYRGAARDKITLSCVPNRVNYYVNFIVGTQFTNVAAAAKYNLASHLRPGPAGWRPVIHIITYVYIHIHVCVHTHTCICMYISIEC
jgi:hypothetical protein